MEQHAPWFATLRGSQGGNVNHTCHKTNFRNFKYLNRVFKGGSRQFPALSKMWILMVHFITTLYQS